MHFDPDIAGVAIVQKRTHARFYRSVLIMVGVRYGRRVAEIEAYKGRVCRRHNILMQRRRCLLDQTGDVCRASGCLAADGRLHGKRPFIDEKPQTHDLRHEQNHHHQKGDL